MYVWMGRSIARTRGVADEEDGCVVPHEVVVTPLRVKLDGEAPRVTLGVSGALLAPNGGEAGSIWVTSSWIFPRGFGEKPFTHSRVRYLDTENTR